MKWRGGGGNFIYPRISLWQRMVQRGRGKRSHCAVADGRSDRIGQRCKAKKAKE